MKLKLTLFACLTLAMQPLLVAQTNTLQSPDDFLPHAYGKEFTPHHLLVDYFQHVADASPNVIVSEYGRTNEHRPLITAVISSEENLAQLEAIRLNNLRKTGLEPGPVDPSLDRVIVWLSYSVHGNEAAGSESSMNVLYKLVGGEDELMTNMLKNTIVIMDPSINPDGYSRYTHWNNRVSNKPFNADVNSMEHNEPWPGGRTNHYFFDLNRDWAWQTQVESQQRLKLYHQWMPHVHADLHEMGRNSPYYFAPAAQPYHEFITNWQSDFQVTVGKNHAKYFDLQGWRYFTKEVFDLLYPSYGDTYPIFSGGIGMTYEQGGSGSAGRSVAVNFGDTLTLQDRIDHHSATSLSTIEVSSLNKDQLVREFENYFRKSISNPPGEYKTFIISHENPQGKIDALLHLLDNQKITYGMVGDSRKISGFAYHEGEQTTTNLHAEDIVISAHQPKGILTQVLFDPSPAIVDSLTYDITAWSLPFAYGLKAWAIKDRLDVKSMVEKNISRPGTVRIKPYSYVMKWESMADVKFLAAALKNGLHARYATKSFASSGNQYAPGTVLFMQADNRKNPDFDRVLLQLSEELAYPIDQLSTGLVDEGKDFGSSSYPLVRIPKILTLTGEGVSSNSAGQVWHFFEQKLGYPVTIIEQGDLSSIDLDLYNLLVMPEGFYRLSDETLKELNSWMRAGGHVIALGSAVSGFADKEGFALKQYAEDDDETEAEKKAKEYRMESRLNHFDSREREFVSSNIPGAIFAAKADPTHPLAFGVGSRYMTLKTSGRHYEHLIGATNVVYLPESLEVYGFAGHRAQQELKNSVVFAVEDKGRGAITYMVDNPLFRSFWESGKFMFSNAVFFVGQ